MTCGHCQGAVRVFGKGRARRELKRYRRKGPVRTTELLVEGLAADGPRDLALLDIGGGIGAVGFELLERGLASVLGVDASTDYVDVVGAEARARGLSDQVEHRIADFVDLAPEIEPVDLVSLDRVICCYPDMEHLLREAASKASVRLGLVYPVDRWWTRALLHLPNAYFWLTRNPFRTFVHDERAVRRVVEDAGLARTDRTRVGLWLVEVYGRSA